LVKQALEDPNPQARGMAVWCLGKVGRSEILDARTDLLEDQGVLRLYRDRDVVETTVAELTRDMLLEGARA
ncbi:HEAT repeat domain-containing protein, partial [Gemmatimonadota bacterium]